MLVLLLSATAVDREHGERLRGRPLQAATQIQDQTLGFVPKLVVVMLVLVAMGPALGGSWCGSPRRCWWRFRRCADVAIDALVLATSLGAARIAPVIWLVPALGGTRLPAQVRVAFAVLLALGAGPALLGAGSTPALDRVSAAGAGLAVRTRGDRGPLPGGGGGRGVPGGGVRRAAGGHAARREHRRGDRPDQRRAGEPARGPLSLVATLLFLQLGGVERLLEALVQATRSSPVGGGLSVGRARRTALVVMASSAKLIADGLALSAPVLVAVGSPTSRWAGGRPRAAVRSTSSGFRSRDCWQWASSCWGWGAYRCCSRGTSRAGLASCRGRSAGSCARIRPDAWSPAPRRAPRFADARAPRRCPRGAPRRSGGCAGLRGGRRRGRAVRGDDRLNGMPEGPSRCACSQPPWLPPLSVGGTAISSSRRPTPP